LNNERGDTEDRTLPTFQDLLEHFEDNVLKVQRDLPHHSLGHLKPAIEGAHVGLKILIVHQRKATTGALLASVVASTCFWILLALVG
jgi:hypothetical protein